MATLIWGRVESEMPRWQPVGGNACIDKTQAGIRLRFIVTPVNPVWMKEGVCVGCGSFHVITSCLDSKI